MRVAISGTHAVGKTTLVRALATRLPDFECIEEAYLLLSDNGVEFSDRPSVDEFDAMFDLAARTLSELEVGSQILDRCPLDYLAYVAALSPAETDLGSQIGQARDALRHLDLVVFVPIEVPDRIETGSITLPRLRRRVDELLRAMLVDDEWGFSVSALEVAGTIAERVDRVCARIATMG